MIKAIVCPITTDRVDTKISRLTIFINAVLMIIFLFTLKPVFIYLVTLDSGIRAFGFKRFSPMGNLAALICRALGIKGKTIIRGPKIFASRLGFICGALGSVWITLNMVLAARIVIGLFATLAILDSVFDYCVGCLIYKELVFPFFNKEENEK